MKTPKFIISGGGTGGHIFPAIAIANALKARFPDGKIHFVGALGRMEMERVPAAGYDITGLPVAGFDRKNLFKNIAVLRKLRLSMALATKTIRDFRPDVVIGVGGYASGPTLRVAAKMGIPTLIQEQNSYPGVTNKLLSRQAKCICVAYDNMEQFFPKAKIVLTGNPVRQDLILPPDKQKAAYEYFGLDPEKKTILVLGGSLGARTINQSILAGFDLLESDPEVQVLWQTGKHYYHDIATQLGNRGTEASVLFTEFITRMDYAYAIADLIISRAGAGSISEFALLGKPVVLVPSPNVAEDHQTKNALALVRNQAALMIPDEQAVEQLVPRCLELLGNPETLDNISARILRMAHPDAAEHIVDEIEKLIRDTAVRRTKN